MTSEWKDEIFQPQMIIMAVFGYNNHLNEKNLHEEILYPLLEEWGRAPDIMLLPSEGKTSIELQEWAESLHRKTKTFHSDWTRNGRAAQILRDDRMMKECTHALIFLSSKSKKLEEFAIKWTQKGKCVFTWEAEQGLVHLENHREVPSKTGRKSNKGTMLEWLQVRPSK